MNDVGQRVRRQRVVVAELGQQPAPAGRQELEVLDVERPGDHLVDQHPVEALEREERVAEQRRDRVRGGEDVRVAEHDQPPLARAVDQPDDGLGHDPAGRLGADDRPRDVEARSGSSWSRL